MDIYVYSDESGVLDRRENEFENNFFVFAGLIFLSKNDKDIFSRKFKKAEKDIRNSHYKNTTFELKANRLRAKEKYSLFRASNNCYRFSAIIDKSKVNKNIYAHKKSRQRYLDYAFKISLKNAFKSLIKDGILNPDEVKNIRVFVDEHTTSTDGCYELREALENEFKIGTFNSNYQKFHPPIFPDMKYLEVNYVNSEKNTLIRASDIIANNIFYRVRNEKDLPKDDKFFIKKLPW